MVSVPVLVNVWNQAKINSKDTSPYSSPMATHLDICCSSEEENDQIELIKKAF